MSDQQQTPPQAPGRSPSGCGTALMILIGIVLLLPGLCTLIYGVGMMVAVSSEGGRLSDLLSTAPIWLVGLVVGALGVGLIVLAVRR